MVYPSRRIREYSFVLAGRNTHHVPRKSPYILKFGATYDWLRYLQTGYINRVYIDLRVLTRQLPLCLTTQVRNLNGQEY